jgi:hypothetical protein
MQNEANTIEEPLSYLTCTRSVVSLAIFSTEEEGIFSQACSQVDPEVWVCADTSLMLIFSTDRASNVDLF